MPHYLDHNATTPVDERVLEVMLPFMVQPHGNPSSVHSFGRYARSAIETAREQVAALVNAQPSEVVFTSGGTEANNLALKGACGRLPKGRLLISPIEHHAVLEPAEQLVQQGWSCDFLPVSEQGVMQLDDFEFAADTRIASMMWANSETGALQPVEQFAALCKTAAVLSHCDAVQGVGKVPVDFAAMGLDLMSLSSHKIYGPKGVGALVKRKAIDLEPMQSGGGQERGVRAGTENIPAIVGFGKAAELAQRELNQRAEHCAALRDDLIKQLSEFSSIKLFSIDVEKLPNTLQLGVPGFDAETLLMELDRKGVAASSGSACASGTGEPSHVLVAMGIDEAAARGAIRVSFGKDSRATDVQAFMEALTSVLRRFGLA